MRRANHRFLSAVGLWLLVILCTGALAQGDSAAALPSSLVAAEAIKSKIAEVEAAAELQAETKTKLVSLYRDALSNLEEISVNTERAAQFARSVQTAVAQIESIRAEAASDADSPHALDVSLATPLRQIERRVMKARAEQAAFNARSADYERRIAYQESRPALIRQRLTAAQGQQEALAASLQVDSTSDERPALIQARHWRMETQYQAISAEIIMLEQELLSQPARLTLLEVKRDQQATGIDRIAEQIKALDALVNEKRRDQAEQAKAEAQQMVRATAGMDPVLVRLAEENAELTDELNEIAGKLDALGEEQDYAQRMAERIKANNSRVEATMEIGGLTEGIGELLLEHRRALPDFKVYERKARERRREMAAADVRQLRLQEEAARIADTDSAVRDLAAKLPAGQGTRLTDTLHDLIERRQHLIGKLLEAQGNYLFRLRRLQAAEMRMLDTARTYEVFMGEHLFWLRTEGSTSLADLTQLPRESLILFSPEVWSELSRAFRDQVARSPVFWLALLAAAVLLWKRRALITAIEAARPLLGIRDKDSFRRTLEALALTLLVPAPLPLIMAVTGWQLMVATQGTDLTHGVGFGTLRIAIFLFVLLALLVMCIPKGLAVAHFRWPKASVQRLRAELRWLIWIFVPVGLIARFAMGVDPTTTGGVVVRIGAVVVYLALFVFLYRVLHPSRGVLAYQRHAQEPGLLARTLMLWFLVLVGFPLAIIGFALGGYMYSAVELSFGFLASLLLIVGLVVLNALAMRWLRVVHRQLAREAELERQQAVMEARKAGESDAAGEETAALEGEFADVDLDALSEESRELLKIAVTFTALAGLYFIWSSVLPALGILDDVVLWHHTATVDGEEQRLPVTLADLGLALIYAIGVGVLAKRLPAVLEIILLQRFDMSPGSRYTITTLTNYATVTIGILLVFNTVGAQWSQLQWLVAALGVGIGFGLQEIVANFISGLIILFERPIRVGDIVTVGDTDGLVTKIRIRATTIRNWDRKELLVPNKEFITGRLLNWSLSDQMTRIVIVVGVAYGSDVDEAHALMREAAEEDENVLDDPHPVVSFEGFGDNSLTLLLRAYLDDLDLRIPTITALHKAINRKFNEAGITIAFPQRDLHLDTNGPLHVTIDGAGREIQEAGKSDSAGEAK